MPVIYMKRVTIRTVKMDPTKMKRTWRELLISKFVNRVWWIYEQRSDLLEATSIVIIFVYYACNLHEKKELDYIQIRKIFNTKKLT